MARSGGRGSVVAAVTALALLATPLPALADFAVNIVAPGYPALGLTVNDNDGVHDQNPAAGGIQISTIGLLALPPITGFLFTLDTVQTNSPGGPLSSTLELFWSLASTSGGGGTVQITASADDFTYPTGTSRLTSVVKDGTLAPPGGTSTIEAQQWVNLANVLFGMGVVTPGLQGPFNTATFGSTASVNFTPSGPFSITDRVTLNLDPSSLTAGNLNSTVVPEPMTMFLGGTGLLALAYAGRRRLFNR